MHSNVTIKNISWLHFSWATLYITTCVINETAFLEHTVSVMTDRLI